MKVFISGPMSGKPYHNNAAFFKAQDDLERHGYSVWNPAWLAYPNNTEFSKEAIHAINNEALRHCDAIYMLKGWQYSKGALAEYEFAIKQGLITIHEDECCFGKHLRVAKHYDSVYGLTAAKFDDVNQAVNDVEADLDNFKNETYGKIEDLYDTSHRHGENIDLCLSEINSLERRCNNRYADSLNKINGLKKEVEAIKESIGSDNLQEQLEKDFTDIYDEFRNTKDMVNDINFGYIDWSSKMSTAIEHIEETRKHVMSFYDGEFIDTFNKVDERLKKLEKTVNGLNSIVGTLGNRLEKIENLVGKKDED